MTINLFPEFHDIQQLPKIKYIYHLSDIHIRNDTNRHAEYRHVFENLTTIIKNDIKSSSSKSLIVVTGDILHNKTILKPECIQLTKEFFVSLADICDVIVILGNHDCNINNRSSLDALTPIITGGVTTKNRIFILDKDETYEYHNIIFGVTTIYAKQVTCLHEFQHDPRIRIGLYHGTLRYNFYTNKEEYFPIESFNEYDLVMLGDIHKHRYLNEARTMAYASSLIQQDYGESLLDHGFIKWNIEDKSSQFQRVPNDYGFVTVYLDENGLTIPTDGIPAYPCIRLFYSNVTRDQIILAEQDLRKEYAVRDFSSYEGIDKTKPFDCKKGKSITDISKDNVTDVIRDYLNLNCLYHLDHSNNIVRQIENIVKNYTMESHGCKLVQLDKIEFSNLFSYGADNKVDFNKFHNIIGIVAKNGYGKSAFVDAILYGIFNKFSRGEKTGIMNMRSKNCECCLSLKINTDTVKIVRNIQKVQHKSRVEFKQQIEFYYNDDLVTAEDKNTTNKDIYNRICTFDDLVSSAVIMQNGQNFLDISDVDKKELVVRLFNLDILDYIYKEARYKSNSTKHIITQYNYDNKKNDQHELEKQLVILTESLGVIVDKTRTLSEQLLILQDQTGNPLMVNSLRKDILSECDIFSRLKHEFKDIRQRIRDYDRLVTTSDIYKDILSRYHSTEPLVDQRSIYLKELDNLEIEAFVSKQSDRIIKFHAERAKYVRAINEGIANVIYIKDGIKKINDTIKDIDITDLQKRRNVLQSDISTKIDNIKRMESRLTSLIPVSASDLKKYKKQICEISILKSDNDSQLESIQTEITAIKQKLFQISDTNEKIAQCQNDKKVYDQIVELFDKGGLQKYIMESFVVCKIEQAVNDILKSITDLQIKLFYEKNGIAVKRILGTDEFLEAEYLCGFEKFIVNITFRLVFNTLNRKVQTDFMIIDEGFTCCDGENIKQLEKLFDIIREKYRWCMVVSHQGELKKYYDKVLTIAMEDGFGSIKMPI